MQIVIKKKINGNIVEFNASERDFKESMLKLSHLLEEDYCWLEEFKADTTKFYWKVKKAKAKDKDQWFTYVERHALNSKGQHAVSTLGQYQDNSGYFWKKWEILQPREDKNDAEKELDEQIPDDINPEDIPFN